MNVASKELCEQLYKLSGWGKYIRGELQPYWEVSQFQYVQDGGDISTAYKYQLDKFEILYPAYDLGYLLRKLPPVLQEDGKFLVLSMYMQGDGTVHLVYTEPYDKEFRGWHITNADTPEDAACKLALELFKQGILTK